MPKIVALLAEGVDRNIIDLADAIKKIGSPSSRRAWIEIMLQWNRTLAYTVALLAEGVDRNTTSSLRLTNPLHVALLAEGVDRNSLVEQNDPVQHRRPPRGGRG